MASDPVNKAKRRVDLTLLLDEMLAATGGPLTARERRKADSALGAHKPRAKSRTSTE
jgi:hypothetical protein